MEAWYEFLIHLVDVLESPSSNKRKYFIDYGTGVASWGVFIFSTLNIFNHLFEVDLFFTIFCYISLFLFGLLLLALEDFRAYLLTRQVLKQRLKAWLTKYLVLIRNVFIRAPERIIQKVKSGVTAPVKEETERPSPPHDRRSNNGASGSRDLTTPEREMQEYGRQAMKRDLADIIVPASLRSSALDRLLEPRRSLRLRKREAVADGPPTRQRKPSESEDPTRQEEASEEESVGIMQRQPSVPIRAPRRRTISESEGSARQEASGSDAPSRPRRSDRRRSFLGSY